MLNRLRKNLGDKFTLMLVAQKSSKMISFRLPGSVLASLLIVAVLFSGASGYAVYRMIETNAEIASLNDIQEQYFMQRISVEKLSKEVNDFRVDMERLNELDYKLRSIVNMGEASTGGVRYGSGGLASSIKLSNSESLEDLDVVEILNRDLASMKEQVMYQEESIDTLRSYLINQSDLLNRTPYVIPLRGITSSGYGMRDDPFTGQPGFHEGIDIVAPLGTTITAPADGVVTAAVVDPHMGNFLVIDHGYGVVTRYGHNQEILVREGQKINRGQPIATLGSSGRSTGPHLHYEIRVNDVSVNPKNFIIQDNKN